MAPGNIQKLSALFSGINKQISMDEFEDKLVNQKIVYIAQENGINLGYDFEWYLRGPYCKLVSEDAHKILDSKINTKLSESELDKEKVEEFSKKLQPYINNSEWLEIAGSLIYLRNNHYPNREIEEIVGYLLDDLSYGYKNFNESLVRTVLVEIMKIGLLK